MMALANLLSALGDDSITLNYSEVSVHVTSLNKKSYSFRHSFQHFPGRGEIRLESWGNKIYLPPSQMLKLERIAHVKSNVFKRIKPLKWESFVGIYIFVPLVHEIGMHLNVLHSYSQRDDGRS